MGSRNLQDWKRKQCAGVGRTTQQSGGSRGCENQGRPSKTMTIQKVVAKLERQRFTEIRVVSRDRDNEKKIGISGWGHGGGGGV